MALKGEGSSSTADIKHARAHRRATTPNAFITRDLMPGFVERCHSHCDLDFPAQGHSLS